MNDETQRSYDALAAEYSTLFADELSGKPLYRAVLGAFVELVGERPAVDLGCGPGHITAYLNRLGLDVRGIDLSPAMVDVARSAHPDVRFEVGTMEALDVATGSLGGITALYSIIHTPPERLPVVFAEMWRVLAPGGQLLVAFQVGDEVLHITERGGKQISLHAYRRSPDEIAQGLAEAGFETRARVVRSPDANEKVEQAYLLVTKPLASAYAGHSTH